jgi:hypothetical protein
LSNKSFETTDGADRLANQKYKNGYCDEVVEKTCIAFTTLRQVGKESHESMAKKYVVPNAVHLETNDVCHETTPTSVAFGLCAMEI